MITYKGETISTCEFETEENGYKYRCPRLQSDDWDELEDPCQDCGHRRWTVIGKTNGEEDPEPSTKHEAPSTEEEAAL